MNMNGAEKKMRPLTSARVASLRELLREHDCIRFMEVSNPLSALIVESLAITDQRNIPVSYDGFWSSSLSDSTSRGKPDIELLDIRSRIPNILEIFENTSKPMIIDGDTGGKAEHLKLNIGVLENVGISAVIIEDKTGLKKNSLLGNSVPQEQDGIASFCEKIEIARAARTNPDFMVIARIESLILDKGLKDALHRARAYVEAGADGIMIHSRHKDPGEVFAFTQHFRQEDPETTLVSVPTSYYDVHFDQLREVGFNIVIYANQLLRAAYPAMEAVAQSILRNGRSSEIERSLLSIDQVLALIPGTN